MSKEAAETFLKKSSGTIQFIPNAGQWDSSILYRGTMAGGEMLITSTGLHMISYKIEKTDSLLDDDGVDQQFLKGVLADDEENENHFVQVQGWEIQFEGQNSNIQYEAAKSAPTIYNYYCGNDSSKWGSNIQSIDELVLKNVYDFIDLRLYSQSEGQVEFDWIVNPGGDPSQIKMKFPGVDSSKIESNGNLSAHLRFATIQFSIPETYQIINNNKVAVDVRFDFVNDSVIGYELSSSYNNFFPLIIDPTFKWGIFMDCNNTSFDEYLFAIDYDASNNVFCGGAINCQLPASYISAGLWGYDATYNSASTTGRDAILYKLKNDGTAILAITYYGGSNDEVIYGLDLSPDQTRVFVCGETGGGVPMVGSPFDNSYNGGAEDGFVAVFNTSNLSTLVYSTYLGSNNSTSGDYMATIRAQSASNFVVGGTMRATAGAAYLASAADNSRSSAEMYMARFTGLNTLAMGTYIGGNTNEQLNDIQIFSDGTIAFTGSSNSTSNFPALVNACGSASSANDGVVGVIPAGGGSFSMLSKIGGTGDDYFFGIFIGQNDTIFITGYSTSNNFPLGTGANAGNRYDVTQNGAEDVVVCKIPRTGNTGGTDPWMATYFGGSGNDRGNAVGTYKKISLIIFGETQSNNLPTKNAMGGTFFSSVLRGGWDMCFFCLETDLKTLDFSTYIGGTGNDYLGETGSQRGSNQMKIRNDSLIMLGTTTHSDKATFTPNVIGPTSGAAPVFDSVKSSSGDDAHLILSVRTTPLLDLDFSDAPLPYPTTKHRIGSANLKIGSNIDPEDSTQQQAPALFDDNTGNTPDDEDGVGSSYLTIPDTTTVYNLFVSTSNTTGANVNLVAWFDWDDNGTFDNSEHKTVTIPSGTTGANFSWSGITGMLTKDSLYLRLRISSDAMLSGATPGVSGTATDGEVEDYLIVVVHPVNPLPVELLSFDATKNNSVVDLDWVTASEKNSSYFIVEKSIDLISWRIVDSLGAAGFSLKTIPYYARDMAPSPGNNYYRLRQVDIDGAQNYSLIRLVKFDATFLITAFPNPSSNEIFLTSGNSSSGIFYCKLMNEVGVIIREWTMASLDQPISVAELPPGFYWLILKDRIGEVGTAQIVKN